MNLEYKDNSLTGLLKDVKIKLCAFLNPHEIMNLCLTSKANASLLKEKGLYQILFDFFCPESFVIYPGNQADPSESRWNFTLNNYKTIIDLVYNLIVKCGDNKLLQKHFWGSVASQDRKHSIEKGLTSIGAKLPLDCYILYRIAHGSKEFEKSKKKFLQKGFMFNKIFGCFNYYDRLYAWELNTVPSQTKKSGNFEYYPMFTSYNKQYALFLDIKNQFGKGVGTIYSMTNRRDDFQTNKIWIKVFVYRKSLTALLEDANRHPYDENRGFIDLCDTLDNAKGDVTTQGIRVRTNCFYSAWDRSYENNELFSYQIRYSDNGVNGSYKLTTRHWVITDQDQRRNVDGPGVIGYYPEVFKGSEDFYYESCSPMYDFSGSIKGKFKFKNMDDEEDEIEVMAPEMKFEFPKGSALLEFCASDNVVNTIIDRLNE